MSANKHSSVTAVTPDVVADPPLGTAEIAGTEGTEPGWLVCVVWFVGTLMRSSPLFGLPSGPQMRLSKWSQ
jgi:hypothetical protein